MKAINLKFCGRSWYKDPGEDYPFQSYIGPRFQVNLDCEPDYLFVKETNDSIEEFLRLRKDRQIRIFLSGEALVPDFNLFDYALGFDVLSFSDRYHRLHTLEFFRRYLQYGDLFAKRDAEDLFREKTAFCNFIYSNPNANPKRDEFFHRLAAKKGVDSLGNHLRNTASEILRTNWDDDWRASKVLAQRKYKFSIAFENATHLGYITEKLITAMLANSVPIYWGDPQVGKHFNQGALVDIARFGDIDEAIEFILRLDADPVAYKSVLGEPWMTRQQVDALHQSERQTLEFFSNIFAQDIGAARRRGSGTWNSTYEAEFVRMYGGLLATPASTTSHTTWGARVLRAISRHSVKP
jgi:hypothetical protein